MSHWIEGRVVGQKRWTDNLYSLQVQADISPFEAGQFARLALPAIASSAAAPSTAASGADAAGADASDADAAGDAPAKLAAAEMIARPYSLVNAPHVRPLEFYYIEVPEGPLTPRLARLQAGDPIFIMPRASGFLVLSEVPDAQHLWLIATGTGIGPFLSILHTEAPWNRFQRIVLVHAVRRAAELSYSQQIGQLLALHPEQLSYVPFVSREAHAGALTGRVPAAIEDGRLEAAAGVTLAAENSQLMLCGNPAMVATTIEVLEARGMKKHRRRDPGHITVENYWK